MGILVKQVALKGVAFYLKRVFTIYMAKNTTTQEYGKNRKADDKRRNLNKAAKREAIREQRYN